MTIMLTRIRVAAVGAAILFMSGVAGCTVVADQTGDRRPSVPRFVDVSRLAGVDIIGDWMSVSFGDFDEDLDIDVFTGNFGGSNYVKPEVDNPAEQIVSGTAEYHRSADYGDAPHPSARVRMRLKPSGSNGCSLSTWNTAPSAAALDDHRRHRRSHRDCQDPHASRLSARAPPDPRRGYSIDSK